MGVEVQFLTLFWKFSPSVSITDGSRPLTSWRHVFYLAAARFLLFNPLCVDYEMLYFFNVNLWLVSLGITGVHKHYVKLAT